MTMSMSPQIQPYIYSFPHRHMTLTLAEIIPLIERDSLSSTFQNDSTQQRLLYLPLASLLAGQHQCIPEMPPVDVYRPEHL